MLIQILLEKNVPVSKLCDIITLYPQVMVNVKVKEDKKYEYENNKIIKEEITKIEEEFSKNGRIIIRPSGTEPLIRIMIEGQDQKYITEKAEKLAAIMEKELN